jgi:hypothetical protein
MVAVLAVLVGSIAFVAAGLDAVVVPRERSDWVVPVTHPPNALHPRIETSA